MVTVTQHQQQLRRARSTSRLVDDFASRLTPRDRWICQMLYEHRCLTVHQITALAFDSVNAAQHRLLVLYRHRILARFRPFRSTGSAPYHYVLDHGGAAVVAALRGEEDDDELAWRRDKALGIAHSQRLEHLVATNGFFAALAASGRHNGHRGHAGRLAVWWSERRCAQTPYARVRPDGYGEWHTPDGQVTRFFLECDMGTEPHDRLAAKVHGYAALAADTDHDPGLATRGIAVLVWFHSSLREATFHTRLARADVPVATASAPADPTAPVWRAWGRPINQRVSLAEAAAQATVTPRPADEPARQMRYASTRTHWQQQLADAAAEAVDPAWPPPPLY